MNGQDRKLFGKFQSDFLYQMGKLVERVNGIDDEVKEIKDNHIKHLDGRITGLYFTVIGGFIMIMAMIIAKIIIGGN